MKNQPTSRVAAIRGITKRVNMKSMEARRQSWDLSCNMSSPCKVKHRSIPKENVIKTCPTADKRRKRQITGSVLNELNTSSDVFIAGDKSHRSQIRSSHRFCLCVWELMWDVYWFKCGREEKSLKSNQTGNKIPGLD